MRATPPASASARARKAVAGWRGPDRVVPVIHWPTESDLRALLARQHVPRVLLVAHGHPPPDAWAEDEDWILAPADAVDLEQRSITLRRRALDRVYVDEDGVVTRDGRWAALSTIESALFATLFRRAGEIVSGPELAEVAWAGKTPTVGQMRAAVDRTRRKLWHLGIAVHRVRGRGHLLEVLPHVPRSGLTYSDIGI